jgi:aconitate hydratase
VKNIMFTTFNRNFKARNDANPETLAFLTSPTMAACLALSGDAGFNPETDALMGRTGIHFNADAARPPSPAGGRIVPSRIRAYRRPQRREEAVKIDPQSERLELLKPFPPWDGKDFKNLPVLVKTRGKTTTDHISPGGEWLKYRGHLTNISRNMLAGALNAFTGETGHGTNTLTGEKGVRLSELAQIYQKDCGGSVIVGDENYGEGSSREHAAMSPRFLGVKAVITRSFARIHEANLKKQGILPLTFRNPSDYDRIGENDRISLMDLEGPQTPRTGFNAVVHPKSAPDFEIALRHTLTEEQMNWFQRRIRIEHGTESRLTMPQFDLIIENGTFLTMDPENRVIENGVLCVSKIPFPTLGNAFSGANASKDHRR